ncbi:MAG TPA: VWA domain-containing protein [Blastocatellia bacterium]|nr:VWA domain-containing protein [Blastocatellia bacterium]
MKDQPRALLRLLCVACLLALTLATVLSRTGPGQQPRTAFTPSAPGDDGRVAISTEVISVTVSITDTHGRFITGLPRDAFQVYEDKVVQEVSFFSAQDAPASIGVVFDLSGSMQGEKIRRARAALRQFIQTSHPDDEYSLIGFSDRAQVLLENTSDSEALLNRLAGIQPGGDTALYDAVGLGLGQVSQGKWPKRALIIISDGEDNNSRLTLKKIRQMVKEADVLIYGILIREYVPRGLGDLVMDELSRISGGRYFLADGPEQMTEAFDRIALELRQQYSIGYVPTRFVADGKWRRIRVRVTPPPDNSKIVVRAREGYYAVADRSHRTRNTVSESSR